MNQDKELEKLKAKKLKKMQDAAKAVYISPEQSAELDRLQHTCSNCGGFVTEDLMTQLKPEIRFCPTCIIMAAKAFVNSKSFMIEIASNKKKTFARVREYHPENNSMGEQKIIDIEKMPIISVVGNVDFFKMVPRKGAKK